MGVDTDADMDADVYVKQARTTYAVGYRKRGVAEWIFVGRFRAIQARVVKLGASILVEYLARRCRWCWRMWDRCRPARTRVLVDINLKLPAAHFLLVALYRRFAASWF